MKSISELQELIKTEIERLTYGSHPENLYEPIRYIMSLGGKRLRPALVLLAYQLNEKEPDDVMLPALSVEVFHNFTLMHDDIMDQAPLRRGKQTVHEKWNQTVAILSGDTMLVKAYELVLHVDTSILKKAIERFNQTACEVCEGQQIDMNFEETHRVSESEYLEMIRLKTAVLLGFSLEFGGMMAMMDKKETDLLYQIGENMGIGFQLMDDYLDVYADQKKFGKQVGGDIISNKKTYLLINALEKANDRQKEELSGWLMAKEFDPKEKVSEVTRIYNEIGIPEMTKLKMDQYFSHSFDLLDQLDASEKGKTELKNFAEMLMKRER